ncbi:hypothetical protein C84B14_08852 [Salinisphaera sp. C84B14]|uniref:hypothetical protein n=1 Tax=Salinisphaera sp. C84B14 TaxID=1304155 RepID=UPI0033408F85
MSDETISNMDHDEFTDFIFDEIENAPAALTRELVDRIEKNAQGMGLNRRIALLTMTISGSEFLRSIREDRELAVAYASAAECAKDDPQNLRHLADLIETFNTRTMVALCQREDMEEIETEAKRDLVTA